MRGGVNWKKKRGMGSNYEEGTAVVSRGECAPKAKEGL